MGKQIYEAFDGIHAEEKLKQNTKHFLYNKIQKHENFSSKILCRRFVFVIISCLLISSIAFSALYFTPQAYIDIDINPSLEITLNSFGRVINANAYNDDGKIILQEVNIKNKSYNKTVELLIQTMIQHGYMKQEDLVSITLQINNERKENKMLDTLEESVFSTLDNHHMNAITEIYTINNEVLTSAHEHNLSPARYLAITKLQEFDEEASYDSCAGHSLSDLREEQIVHNNKHHNTKVEDDITTYSHH